jgi:hypothetical protein
MPTQGNLRIVVGLSVESETFFKGWTLALEISDVLLHNNLKLLSCR